MLCRVTRHPALGHARVLRRGLLLLEILLVMESSLGSHVRGRHAGVGGHATRLSSGNLGVAVLG